MWACEAKGQYARGWVGGKLAMQGKGWGKHAKQGDGHARGNPAGWGISPSLRSCNGGCLCRRAPRGCRPGTGTPWSAGHVLSPGQPPRVMGNGCWGGLGPVSLHSLIRSLAMGIRCCMHSSPPLHPWWDAKSASLHAAPHSSQILPRTCHILPACPRRADCTATPPQDGPAAPAQQLG